MNQQLDSFASLPYIIDTPGRILSTEKLLSIIAPTPNFPTPQLNVSEDFLASISESNDNISFAVKGVGFYRGVPDVAKCKKNNI